MEDIDFICEWCHKDIMHPSGWDTDMDYITLSGPSHSMMQLCRSCYITALQALQFGKEVVQDCPEGKRIYVAVEKTGQESELLNVLTWPNHPLSEHVKPAKRVSIMYRVSQDL